MAQLAFLVPHFQSMVKGALVLLFFLVELTMAGCVTMVFLRSSEDELSLPGFILPGLFVATAFGETWSLFGGLSPWANPALVFSLAILVVVRRKAFMETLRDGLRHTRWINLILLVPLFFIVAINALTDGSCYDTLLYHLAGVRWFAEFGSVPGLANLHGRLGFNTALHPLAALFGSPFGVAIGREFVNPVVIISVGAVILQKVRLVLSQKSTPGSVYAWLLLPLFVNLVFSECLSSPQPDVASAGLALLVGWYLQDVLFEAGARPGHGSDAFVLCLMSGSLVLMLKLSYGVFGLLAAGLATATVLFRSRRSGIGMRTLSTSLLFVCLLSIPWLLSGYLTSGYPFFPSELGRLPFDWTVPHQLALNERNWILSWARAPNQNWQTVLGNNAWFLPWLTATLAKPDVVKPLIVFATGLVFIMFSSPLQYRKDAFLRWCSFFGVILLSLLFWFLTAPSPRFAQATLWLLGTSIVYLPFVCSDRPKTALRIAMVIMVATFACFETIVGFGQLRKGGKHFPNYVGGPPRLVARQTLSGLTVWMPAEGDPPGSWTIPATPPDRFDPHLELRGKTLRDGFRIKEEGEGR
jgi:hypothetical protein